MMNLLRTTLLVISTVVIMASMAGCSGNNGASGERGKAHFTPGPGIPPGMLAKANAYMRAKQQGTAK